MKRLLVIGVLLGGCKAFEIPQFTPAGVKPEVTATAADNTITISYQAQLSLDGMSGRVALAEDGTTLTIRNYLQVKDATLDLAKAGFETVTLTLSNMPKGDYTIQVVGSQAAPQQKVSIASDTAQKKKIKLDLSPIAQNVALGHSSEATLQRVTAVTDGTGVAFLNFQ